MSTDELSSIWLRQSVPAPPPEKELLANAHAVKRKIYFKQGFAVLLLVATLIALNLFILPAHPRLMTTRVGMGLVNLALVVYLAASGDMIYLWLRRTKQDLSVKEELQSMLLLKKRQHFMYSRLLGVYFILLFAGILLYMAEYVRNMPFFLGITFYVLTIGWGVFAWLFFRPRAIEKYNKPVEAVIDELERVAVQLDVNS